MLSEVSNHNMECHIREADYEIKNEGKHYQLKTVFNYFKALMKYSQRNMVIRKMQTTDYTSISSLFATYGAIKSLWINENLTKLLSKVSVEIIHGVRETLSYREFINPLKSSSFFF